MKKPKTSIEELSMADQMFVQQYVEKILQNQEMINDDGVVQCGLGEEKGKIKKLITGVLHRRDVLSIPFSNN